MYRKEKLELQLEFVRDEQKRIIKTYCDGIGCKACPLWEPDSNCESISLQNQEFNIEKQISQL